ncbi:MAG: hypothetical protein RI958_2565 [Actinomycetota bacterium]|jgi:diguanylate cyclase (GGDEF)-like protein/PAS domain S-box-containing protein
MTDLLPPAGGEQPLSALPVAVFQTDRRGRLTAANTAFRELVTDGGAPTPDSAPWSSAHPSDRAEAETLWAQAAEHEHPVSIGFRVWSRNGTQRWITITASPVRDQFGRTTGYAGVALDDTNTVDRGVLLDRLLGLVGPSADAVAIFDRDEAPVYLNQAARALLGLDQATDQVADQVTDPATESVARTLLTTARDQMPRRLVTSTVTSRWNGEIGFRGADAIERVLDVDLVVERDPQGMVDHWGMVARDVTARNHLQTELLHQATHDALTGLPNRVLLLRRTAEALDGLRGGRGAIALLFLDLDKLKDVNDSAGHDIGDALLTHVAHRIASATRPSDVIARIGGDEFVVLCDGSLDEHAALDVAERVRLALSGRAMIRGVEVDITVSVGVALVDALHLDGVTSPDAALALLQQADAAMYTAKRRGRSRVELYTEAMRSETAQQRQLTSELERALANDELRIVYQPVMAAHSGRIVGAEALLRWEHPTRGTVLPAQFIHLAVESGAIVPIGDWLIERACSDAASWIADGTVERTFTIHVNIAARQLQEGSFVERVLAVIRSCDLSPNQLTMDIAETTIGEAIGGTSRALQALRRFGVRIALDDFGSGASSLTVLRASSADVLKLDGTLARGLGANTDDDPIVRAMIQFAHALDMQVIAEWVSSADQLHRLRMLGCDMVQGNLLGEPVPADRFAQRYQRSGNG